MAWLQNLAGRAEDLLNKIDQNAATVLNDSGHKNMDVETGSTDAGEINLTINDEDNKSKFVPNQLYTDSLIKSTFQEDSNLLSIQETSESPSKKSNSSSNSFILADDIQNFTENINKLESEVNNLNKQLLHYQHLYSELRNENTNLRVQVDTSNSLMKTAQSEMEQYKVRAQRILQEKEDLIQLKNENTNLENCDLIISTYNEEMKKEIEFQQNKNTELSEKVQKLSEENSILQQQIIETQNSSQRSIKILEENLLKENHFKTMLEEDCRLKNYEIQSKMQDLSQFNQLMQAKNEEIDKLRDAFKSKSNLNVNNDFEIRIKSLTNTLLLKQNALETVTTERNALRIQFEKLEGKYNNLLQSERIQVRVVNVNDTDDVKSQVPQFLRVSPIDAGVTRRVKHAYSTLDSISTRVEILFRRYPVARVFLLCYTVLLHLWAIILLFVYAPSNK